PLPFQYMSEIPHHGGADLLAAFDGSEHAAPRPAGAVREKQFAVDAAISALFLLPQGMRIEQIVRPPLELIFIALGKLDCGFKNRAACPRYCILLHYPDFPKGGPQ